MKSSLFQIYIIIIAFNICLNSFQASLFQKINKQFRNKNLIISPLSAFQILSLTAHGAKGKTLEEIILALSCKDINDLNEINIRIYDKAKKFSSIEMANAVMTAFTPEPKFTSMAYFYRSTVEALRDVDQVNNWCDVKTHGKIKKIIDEIEPNTMMILLNAIYFKGTWYKQFDPKYTKKLNFYNFGEEKNGVMVDMMNIIEKFNYFENDYLQAIEIPFSKDSATAIILLPREYIDINNFIIKLDEESIQNYINEMSTYNVELNLPKFELEFSSELNSALERLGMEEAFDASKADLTDMRKEGNIYISKVIQKTYLKVDEQGAEAAADTAVIIKTRSIIKKMNVNRPFIMILKSKVLPNNNDMLFIAKIEKL